MSTDILVYSKNFCNLEISCWSTQTKKLTGMSMTGLLSKLYSLNDQARNGNLFLLIYKKNHKIKLVNAKSPHAGNLPNYRCVTLMWSSKVTMLISRNYLYPPPGSHWELWLVQSFSCQHSYWCVRYVRFRPVWSAAFSLVVSSSRQQLSAEKNSHVCKL